MDNNCNMVIYIYRGLNRTPNIDSYWVGAVPKATPFVLIIQTLGYITGAQACENRGAETSSENDNTHLESLPKGSKATTFKFLNRNPV